MWSSVGLLLFLWARVFCQLFLLKKSSAIATASSLTIVAIVELRQLLRPSANSGRFLKDLAGEILIARRASPQGPQKRGERKKKRKREKKRREKKRRREKRRRYYTMCLVWWCNILQLKWVNFSCHPCSSVLTQAMYKQEYVLLLSAYFVIILFSKHIYT